MDVFSLLRFLSEAVWLLTALQPSDYLEWAELILIQRKYLLKIIIILPPEFLLLMKKGNC